MKEFTVYLHRDYKISIKAKNKEEAKFLTEYVIGGEKDISNDKEKTQFKFKIENIEMMTNEVIEINEE